MSAEQHARSAHLIVVGNEKGGSGKSTVAMHLAVALMKSGQRVATVDLDSRQKSFTHYVENRRAWAQHIARDIEIPNHLLLDAIDHPTAVDERAECNALNDAVDTLSKTYSFIVIDTPGHDKEVMRLAHSMADTLITPLNDSFLDLDVLGLVDPQTFAVTGISHYSRMVDEARRQRKALDGVTISWFVLRNRLSALGSRNKHLVGEALQDLSQRLAFRYIEGLSERMIFREFYPRGLTAVDDIDQITLGMRPTLSHVTARLEVESLLRSIGLGDPLAVGENVGDARDAA